MFKIKRQFIYLLFGLELKTVLGSLDKHCFLLVLFLRKGYLGSKNLSKLSDIIETRKMHYSDVRDQCFQLWIYVT